MLAFQVPQLIENYRGQSADGISLRFLGIWMLGDLANLIGAFYGGLYVLLEPFSPSVEYFMGYAFRGRKRHVSRRLHNQKLNERTLIPKPL